MPWNQRAIIKLNPGDRVEITSQGELEIMILGNQSQHRRLSRRGHRNQQKQSQTFSCQKHEQPQTPEPQSQQQVQSSENRPQHVPTQAQLPRSQPRKSRFETQQRLPHRWTQPAERLKQRDIDEATRQRTEYRERLQRILDEAQVKSSQSEPKESKYVPVQYQREGESQSQDGSLLQEKRQVQAEKYQLQSDPQSQKGVNRFQSQPQSRPKQQRPYTEPVEKQIDEATWRLSQQGIRSQRLMDVPQSRSASGQPLQQLSHAHPELQLYVPAQYQKPNVQPQKPPQPPQVQSREPFSFPQSVNAPSSPQTLSDRTLQTLFPWMVGAYVDSPRQQHPQSQPQKKQEKQQQQFSSHNTESQKSVPYVLDSCHIPWVSAQLGPGQPPSEPDTDYEQLNFDGSRSPSTVSLSSDSDESIVVIGTWKATEGDGSWW